MPQAHSLASLLAFLQQEVRGVHHSGHDVALIRREMDKWFPRMSEYESYVHWDEDSPSKYTRNLICSSDDMEVLLMCWPAGAASSIHCHDDSSCWVAAVEGEVHEVQYAFPTCDRKFLHEQLRKPSGAIGRCGALRVTNVTKLGGDDAPSTSYICNNIGVHRIENRSSQPAITMHVYAPRLRRMKAFRELPGGGSIVTVTAPSFMSEGGEKTGEWGAHTHPDGIIDVEKWNSAAE